MVFVRIHFAYTVFVRMYMVFARVYTLLVRIYTVFVRTYTMFIRTLRIIKMCQMPERRVIKHGKSTPVNRPQA